MTEKDRGELLFLIKALIAWGICAVILCLIFSILICRTSLDSSYIGYISSFISFICAVTAGYKACVSRKGNAIYTGFFTSIFLVILLLTVGFIVGENNLKSSAVISVGTFTFVGVMAGSNAIPAIFGKKSKRRTKVMKGIHS